MTKNYGTSAFVLSACFLVSISISSKTSFAQTHPVTAARTTDKPTDSATAPVKIGDWTVYNAKTDKGDAQVEIRLSANEPYTAEDGSDLNTADFVIGCTPGNTVAFVDWKGPLVNENNDISVMNISYALDNSQPKSANWDISSDKTSLISKDSVNFIKSLSGKKRMEMQLMPDGLKQETIVFSLANLDDVVKTVGEQCYK